MNLGRLCASYATSPVNKHRTITSGPEPGSHPDIGIGMAPGIVLAYMFATVHGYSDQV